MLERGKALPHVVMVTKSGSPKSPRTTGNEAARVCEKRSKLHSRPQSPLQIKPSGSGDENEQTAPEILLPW